MVKSLSRYRQGFRYCKKCGEWHHLAELSLDTRGALVCSRTKRRVKNKPVGKSMKMFWQEEELKNV